MANKKKNNEKTAKLPKKQINTLLYYFKELENENKCIYKFTVGEEKEEIIVKFKTDINLLEKQNFIEKAVSGVFSTEGEYLPEFKDTIFFYAVIDILSDMPYPTKKVNNLNIIDLEKTDELRKIFIGKYIPEDVTFEITNDIGYRNFMNLIEYLKELVNEAIEFKKEKYLNYNKFDEFIENLNDGLNLLKNKMVDIDFNQLNDAVPYLEKLSKLDLSEKNIVSNIVDINSKKDK